MREDRHGCHRGEDGRGRGTRRRGPKEVTPGQVQGKTPGSCEWTRRRRGVSTPSPVVTSVLTPSDTVGNPVVEEGTPVQVPLSGRQ